MEKFLKDWSESDHKQANKVIRKYLLSRKFTSNQGEHVFRLCNTFKQIDDICGLAYTSSGSAAGLFVCNIHLYLDEGKQWKIYGFLRCLGGWFYALCNDSKGNEITIMIG